MSITHIGNQPKWNVILSRDVKSVGGVEVRENPTNSDKTKETGLRQPTRLNYDPLWIDRMCKDTIKPVGDLHCNGLVVT